MKAILVIDIPLSINCEDLECYEAELKIIDKDADEYVLSKRHLPLKLMPLKMKVDYDTIATCEVTEKVVAMGWNACIDAILGEMEGDENE